MHRPLQIPVERDPKRRIGDARHGDPVVPDLHRGKKRAVHPEEPGDLLRDLPFGTSVTRRTLCTVSAPLVLPLRPGVTILLYPLLQSPLRLSHSRQTLQLPMAEHLQRLFVRHADSPLVHHAEVLLLDFNKCGRTVARNPIRAEPQLLLVQRLLHGASHQPEIRSVKIYVLNRGLSV